jgi:succinoglycan biosynthesis transport protein ExoP
MKDNLIVAKAVQALRDYPRRWIVPTALLTAASLVYVAAIHAPEWVARQTLTVRDEAHASAQQPGRFIDAIDLKNSQETILELATSPLVVGAALVEIGPPADQPATTTWPTPLHIESAQGHIRLTPPGGAEFGSTELFYLTVTDTDRTRAIRLAGALCDQLDRQFKALRDRKARSVMEELTNAVELSSQELERTTSYLAQMESAVGSDLAELRSLHESNGDSNLRATLVEVKQELRATESELQGNQQLVELLSAALQDPAHLVTTPNRLLEMHPALRRLKDGLVDVQLATSTLLGTMSEEHPRVLASQEAEKGIRGHLHHELSVAIRGLRAEQSLIRSRHEILTARRAEIDQRLETIAGMRAEYSNLVAEAQQRSQSLNQAQQDLTNAQAAQLAAQATSLITRVDEPYTGASASGPGRSIIVAVGMIGGLLTGLGILVLTLPSGFFDVSSANSTATRLIPNTIQPFGNHSGTEGPTRGLSLRDALARFANDPPSWN